MATLVFTMLSAILTAVLVGPSSGQAYELLAPTVSCSNISQIPRSECLALEALYNSTNGPGWNVPSWSQRWFSTTTPCSWAGVTCSGAHVTTLGLDQLELDGTIPAQIGDLDYLRELYMNNNHLSGNIPRELGSLPSLQLLTTYNNNLSGSIPSELGNLGNLRHLDFSWNNLSGSIPAQIGNLANLQRLFLKGNNIGGHIPTSVANLASLQIARFDNNNLVGDVPSVFGRLPNLLELGLQGNELTGPLPQTLVARSLTALDFRNTSICEPRDEAFQTWLNGIQYLGRTGVICPYQPNPFGYRFNNSRARTSWSIFRDTFGAENVEWNGAPNPLAASYYSTYFAAIEGSGVCSGMASSSALLYRGWASPTSFLVNQGAGATWELDGVINQGLLDYGDVANFIVRYQGYQLGKEISNANRNYSL